MLWLKGKTTLPSLARLLVMEESNGASWLEGECQIKSDAAAMFGYWPLLSQPLKVGPSCGTSCELYSI